jgi:4-amino-4-deoxy-L-arabinose transferase-like glycosyltransferase
MPIRLRLIPDFLPRFLARHWFPLVVLAAVVPVALRTCQTRPLWLDEILTYHVLKGGDFGGLWQRLATGTQSDPPLFYLAAAASTALLGDNPVAFRLPALLGVLVMALALYSFVGRRCPPAYARAALLLPLFPPVFEQLYNARPYGLWLGWSGLGLLCWQVAGDAAGWKRRAALLGLAGCSVASVSTHYYAVLFLAALGIAELFRAYRARRLDVPVWLALAVAVIPLLAYRPLIANARSFITGSWAVPVLLGDGEQGLLNAYTSMFVNPLHLVLFAVPGAFLLLSATGLLPRPRRDRAATGVRAEHLVAGLAVCAIPVLGWVLAAAYTNNYSSRYVLPGVCGMAVLAPMVLARLVRGGSLPGHVLVAVTALGLVHASYRELRDRPQPTGARFWRATREADRRARANDTVVVTAGLHTFVETKFYHPEVRIRFVCLATHESTNAVARRLRTFYDGILEPEELSALDPFLVIADRSFSGTHFMEMIESEQLPSQSLAALHGGPAVYLVSAGPAALARRGTVAPLGR